MAQLSEDKDQESDASSAEPPETSSTQGSFKAVFDEECGAIAKRRNNLRIHSDSGALGLPDFSPIISNPRASSVLVNTFEQLRSENQSWRDAETADNVRPGLVGVALSGGGVRSSTFNLGVLQVIHKAGLFPFIDYLSTVSGGGYIGTFLTTNISNKAKALKAGNTEESAKNPVAVDNEAKQDDGDDLFPFVHGSGQEENKEFRHLRNYANFLAPDNNTELFNIPILLLRGLVINSIAISPYLLMIAMSLGFLITNDWFSYQWFWNILAIEQPPISTPFLLSVLLSLLLLFLLGLYPVIYWARAFVLGMNDSDAERQRHRNLKILRYLFMLILVVAFIELQPIVLAQLGETIDVIFSLVFVGSSAAIPFADKIAYGIKKFKANIGLAFYGLIGVLCLWFLVLWLTSLSVNIQWLESDAGVSMREDPRVWIGLTLGLLGYSLLFVDVNANSLHKFYRDRLVAAFVSKIDIDSWLVKGEVAKFSDLDTEFTPYHLVNATVNVRRANPNYKSGRRSGTFFFSPLFCGGVRSGYAGTAEYEKYAKNLDIGTAMAISGAAAAPNMGKFTNPVLAFVLAILNIRLNQWLPNPRKVNAIAALSKSASTAKQSVDEGRDSITRLPMTLFNKVILTVGRVGPLYLLKEIFQSMNEDDYFLNLSDGGHIENLGVYELLRRQCRLIIVGDGERDQTLTFQGLAEVIRLARIDFGFDIKMEGLDEIRSGEQRYAIGTIYYSPTRTGRLIYIKSNLGGDYNLQATLNSEFYRTSADRDDNLLFDNNAYVAYYKKHHGDFPHESTADQFFDEEQFENYRALGFEVASDALLKP